MRRLGRRAALLLAAWVASGCGEVADPLHSDPPPAGIDASAAPAARLDAAGSQPPADAAIADAGPPLPDLALLRSRMLPTVYLSEEGFPPDHCAIAEGCLLLPGFRRLIRFDTAIANLGTADLVLGDPDPDDPLWEYDSCHQHYHYLNFASYQLVRADATVVALGHKQSFCLRDDERVVTGAPSSGYDCTDQGLSVGWSDVYAASLDCQFIDVTEVPPGDYWIRVEVNPSGAVAESRLDNDVVFLPVSL